MSSRYAKETLTVSTAAVPLTFATYKTLFPLSSFSAFISVAAQPIRYFFDGSTPTSTVGHLVYAGETLTFTDYDDIVNFKAIRDTTATGDATLTITYKNKIY